MMSNREEGEREVEDELSNSLLRAVEDAEKADWLREVLSGFSHRCRNSLNGIKLGFYLTRRATAGKLPAVWPDLEMTYEAIEQTIDRLQTIYRPMHLNLVESRLASMVAENEGAWRLRFAERKKVLVIEGPLSESSGQFDPMLLGQGLDALVDWRAETSPCGTVARLCWRCRDDHFQVTWNEESSSTAALDSSGSKGPDTPPGERRRPIDPLVLPLLARIVQAHAGRLQRDPGPSFSIRFVWPMTPGTTGSHRPAMHA